MKDTLSRLTWNDCSAARSLELCFYVSAKRLFVRKINRLRKFERIVRADPIAEFVFEATVLRLINPANRAVGVAVAKDKCGFDRVNYRALRRPVVQQSTACQTVDIGFAELKTLVCDADFTPV